jgi:hypothetical protein
MNYSTHYNLLITRAQNRKLLTHKEAHHIFPKCLGGTNDPTNLVNLTYREHYIAHLLLAKIHGGPLWHAVNLMGRLKKYSNRHYERSRIEHSKMVSKTNKRTKTKPKENRHYKCSNCGIDLVYNEFCHHSPKEHYYCNATCRNQYIAKVRPSQVGRKHNRTAPAWNKGLPNPTSADNARKGAAKLSAKVTGRKRLYKEDGSWVWQYPKK